MNGKIKNGFSRRISRREMLRIMALTSMGGLVAACTSKEVPEAVTEEVTKTVATSPSVTAAAESLTENEINTVRFWNVWGAAREDMMNEIVAGFMEENSDIEVENIVQSYERYQENILTSLTSNDPPEVIMAARAQILQLADDGVIAPFDDLIEKFDVDLSKYYASELGNFQWNGKQYSLPMPTGGGSTSLMLMNLDLFKKAGVDPVVPQTWEELEKVAKELTILDSKGIVQLGADVGTSASKFFAWLYCNNGTIYSDDLKSVAFSSPEGIETLEWMVNFNNEINGGVQNVLSFLSSGGEAQQSEPWYNNLQAIRLENVSIFIAMNTYCPDMKWDMGLRPYNSNNPEAKSQGLAGEQYAWGYVIPESLPTEQKEAAFKWIKRITYDDEGACWFMKQQSRPSPLMACNDDPTYYELNPHWDKVLKSLESDVNLKILPVHTRISDIVDQGVQAALFGDLNPEEALKQAAEQAQLVVDEYWKSS